MRMFRSTVALAAILTTTAVLATGHFFSSPYDAAQNTPRAQHAIARLEADGYGLASTAQHPIMYFVAPTGDFTWGDVTYEMHKDVTPCITSVVTVHVIVDWNSQQQAFSVSAIKSEDSELFKQCLPPPDPNQL